MNSNPGLKLQSCCSGSAAEPTAFGSPGEGLWNPWGGCRTPPGWEAVHTQGVDTLPSKGNTWVFSPKGTKVTQTFCPLLSGTPPGNDSFYRPSLTSPARQAHKSTTPTPVLAQCLTKPRTFSPQAEPLPFAKSMRNIWSLARNYSSVTEHSNPKMRPSCRCSAQLSQHWSFRATELLNWCYSQEV